MNLPKKEALAYQIGDTRARKRMKTTTSEKPKRPRGRPRKELVEGKRPTVSVRPHLRVPDWATHLGIGQQAIRDALNAGLFPNASYPQRSAHDRVFQALIPDIDIEKWLSEGRAHKNGSTT